MPHSMNPFKPIILHLGDPIQYNHDIYDRLRSQFDIVNPPVAERHRAVFLRNLRDKKWGDFQAIMRPFWNTGGEMGRWDRELIEQLPKSVKVSASAGAGFDWVDTDILAKSGILYCNGAGASTEAVSDMALFHIISVFRQMAWSQLAARSGDPREFQNAHLNAPVVSHNPRGHTLGIVGLGNIGYAIAKKAYLAFGMHIAYNDVVRKSRSQEQMVGADFYDQLGDMLAVSDCVLIATPFAGKTLITKSTLAQFKRGSRLVNIARGSLVDEDALADAIDSGHVSAAGMDVHAHEPNVSARLIQSGAVTLTSHTGGAALETAIAFERLAMENVERVLTGKPALTAVNQHLIRQYQQQHQQEHQQQRQHQHQHQTRRPGGGGADHAR